jgi:anti-sigma B factor antagonist
MLAKLAMELTPTDSQDAGRREQARRDEERSLEATPRVSRRRFTFDWSRMPHATVVALGGELDVVCADAFKRRFAEATEDEPTHVVIDLRGLTFIDSTGLGLLLRVNEISQDGGFALSIVSVDDGPPSKIFRMTGTDKVLPLVQAPPDSLPGV